MLPLERADKLKGEADLVLKLIRMEEILLPYSRVFPTGSYYLDVMAYPDIDLYITKITLEQLFEIGSQIASNGQVTQVLFEKSDDLEHLPQGLYLKSRVHYGDWGRPWKIDLWSLPEDVIMHKMEVMQHFQQTITPQLRERIISYKLSVLTPKKRTPMYSGYYIYKAFIDEGMSDFENVTRYLISCGIEFGSQD
jgi:hypothetical protein